MATESSEQAELYLRGHDTLLASWAAYAAGWVRDPFIDFGMTPQATCQSCVPISRIGAFLAENVVAGG
jgi:hypothetical protein